MSYALIRKPSGKEKVASIPEKSTRNSKENSGISPIIGPIPNKKRRIINSTTHSYQSDLTSEVSITSRSKTIFNLRILRGKNLDLKNPYVQICIRDSTKNNKDELVGETQICSNTKNPVYGGTSALFRIEGRRDCVILIRVLDDCYDDKLYSEVVSCFSMKLSHLKRQTREKPNLWVKGIDSNTGKATSGSLQIQVLSPTAWEQFSSSKIALNHPIRIRDVCEKNSFKVPNKDGIPVLLHIYNLSKAITPLNMFTRTLAHGGIYHAGIEIFGLEYSFGCNGIFVESPRENPRHCYGESLYLGSCQMTNKQITLLLAKMEQSWKGESYKLLSKNCCDFCQELAIELGVGKIPSWVNSLAKTAEPFAEKANRIDRTIYKWQKYFTQ